MTVERRFVVGLKDIRAVTLECKKCDARLSMKPEAMANAGPWECPFCTHKWLSDSTTPGKHFISSAMLLLRALSPSLVEEDDKAVGVRILLEFDEPTSGASSASAL